MLMSWSSKKTYEIYKRTPVILPLLMLITCVLCFVGAMIAEFVFFIRPCILCVFQRYVMAMLIIVLSALVVYHQHIRFKKLLSYFALVGVLSGMGLSAYHFGVEQHWWRGPDYCSSDIKKIDTNLSVADQIKAFKSSLEQKNNAPIVRCDEVNWRILNVSATLWNFVLYVFLLMFNILYIRCRSKE